MNKKKVKVSIDNELWEGEIVGFKEIKESWNEYQLEDGTNLKMKLVITRVIRTKKYKANLEPVYYVNSQNVIRADIPKKFKKKAN